MGTISRSWMRGSGMRASFLGGVAAGMLAASGAAFAQGANGRGDGGALIDLAAEIHASPGIEIALPLFIQAPRGAGNLIMLLRGLPADVTISEGRAFGNGVWAVPTASASRLKIRPAASAGGVSEITVALVTPEGAKVAEAMAVLRIVPVQAQPAPPQRIQQSAPVPPQIQQPTPAPPQIQQPAPVPPQIQQQQTASVQPRVVGRVDPGQGGSAAVPARLTVAEEEQLGRLIIRGDESMQTGKVAAARLFYQRAAESGLAAGAMALASTYDASELEKWNIVGGVHADAKLARQWYGKARELGSPEAAQRLLRLDQR